MMPYLYASMRWYHRCRAHCNTHDCGNLLQTICPMYDVVPICINTLMLQVQRSLQHPWLWKASSKQSILFMISYYHIDSFDRHWITLGIIMSETRVQIDTLLYFYPLWWWYSLADLSLLVSYGTFIHVLRLLTEFTCSDCHKVLDTRSRSGSFIKP